MITAIVPGAARAGAFESRSTAGAATPIGTSATAVGAATAFGAATTAVTSTVASAAAERPLEPRTRVAADARGIARKIFAGSCRTPDTRGTSFAREKHDVLLDGYQPFGEGRARNRCDQFLIDMLDMVDFGVLVLGFFVLGFFVFGMFVLGVLVFTMRFGMFGAFLGDVGGKFRAVGRASGFDFFGFFLVELRDGLGMNFLVFNRLFFRFVLFKDSPPCQSIGFRFFGGFFVFGFREIGGKRRNLIFTQIGIATSR